MKTVPDTLQHRAIRYTWRTAHATHTGRTVVSGRTKRDLHRAERRWWALHLHVNPIQEAA